MLLKDLEHTLCAIWTDPERQRKLLDEAQDFKLDNEKVSLYGELIRYGFVEVMASVYPACEKLLGEEAFAELVGRFITVSPPGHYRLNKTALGFADYIATREAVLVEQYPFLAELADYEWIELECLEDPSEADWSPYVVPLIEEDLECLGPALNPVLRIRVYQYRIPEIVESLLHEEGRSGGLLEAGMIGAVNMAVYREAVSHEIRCLEMAEVPMRMIRLLQKRPCSYGDLLSALAQTFEVAEIKPFVLRVMEDIGRLQLKGLFVGSVEFDKEVG